MEKLTRVHVSNLDKVLYPAVTVRKAQVIKYYISVAPRMLGFLNERVVVSNRFPDGVQEEGFYEKDAPSGKPDWVETFTRFSESSRRYIGYVLCSARAHGHPAAEESSRRKTHQKGIKRDCVIMV